MKSRRLMAVAGLSSVAMNWREFRSDLVVDRDSVVRGCGEDGA